MPDQAPRAEAQAFAASFRSFLDWIHTYEGERRNEVSVLVADFLGPDGAGHSVVSRELPPFEHVNLQTAINAWSALPGRTVEVRGVLLPPHYNLEFQQIVSAEVAAATAATDRADDYRPAERPRLDPRLASSWRCCWYPTPAAATSSWFRRQGSTAKAVRSRSPACRSQKPKPSWPNSTTCAPRSTSTGATCSTVTLNPMAASFSPSRSRRTCAATTWCSLRRCSAGVERHALGVAAHRQALLAAGQHLKRGLLLYGPPGTGKTHTTRYLSAR